VLRIDIPVVSMWGLVAFVISASITIPSSRYSIRA